MAWNIKKFVSKHTHMIYIYNIVTNISRVYVKASIFLLLFLFLLFLKGKKNSNEYLETFIFLVFFLLDNKKAVFIPTSYYIWSTHIMLRV